MILIKTLGRVLKFLEIIIETLLRYVPYFDFIKGTKGTQNPIKFSDWFFQILKKDTRYIYWPVHKSSEVSNYKKIIIGVDTSPGFMPGCSLNGYNGIQIGNYTQIASNVGIQSANHNLFDLRKYVDAEPIIIGDYCWIGMNTIILPEVELGDFTIVGAGSVVTKSFQEGYCVIAGNPAKKIRTLDPTNCIRHKEKREFIGFIPKEKFEKYKKKYLK